MAKDYNSYNDSNWGEWISAVGSLIRSDQSPLDKSDLFLSLEDAQKYAGGDDEHPDSRGLYDTAYSGQIIGVRINSVDEPIGVYQAYIIQGDGTLKELGEPFSLMTDGEIEDIFNSND
jgi:hypothetical protein